MATTKEETQPRYHIHLKSGEVLYCDGYTFTGNFIIPAWLVDANSGTVSATPMELSEVTRIVIFKLPETPTSDGSPSEGTAGDRVKAL